MDAICFKAMPEGQQVSQMMYIDVLPISTISQIYSHKIYGAEQYVKCYIFLVDGSRMIRK